MNKDNFSEIATAVTMMLNDLVLTGVSIPVTHKLIIWFMGT